MHLPAQRTNEPERNRDIITAKIHQPAFTRTLTHIPIRPRATSTLSLLVLVGRGGRGVRAILVRRQRM